MFKFLILVFILVGIIDISVVMSNRNIEDEIDKIIEDVRTDKVSTLRRENKSLQMRLEHLASLDDCDEEFEM